MADDRFYKDAKWPVDSTLEVVDISSSYEAELALELTKVREDEAKGLRAIVTRHCSAGVGAVTISGEYLQDGELSEASQSYNLRPPASFECPFRSAHCYDNSPVFCEFSAEFATEIVRMYDDEVEVAQGDADRLKRIYRGIDGKGQTVRLKAKLKSDLEVASSRMYIMEPWLRFHSFIPVVDAIIIFSTFATLGVTMGIVTASSISGKHA